MEDVEGKVMLILPHEPPKHGTLLDAKGKPVKRMTRIEATTCRVTRLDAEGNPTVPSIPIEASTIVLWTRIDA